MSRSYEWDVETVYSGDDSDEFADGDIIDHNHFDTYAECAVFAVNPPENCRYKIVLVCNDVGRDGLDDRSWAYLLDIGVLPSHTFDAYNLPVHIVPMKYHKEIQRYRLTAAKKSV